jgi:hypothetical protein
MDSIEKRHMFPHPNIPISGHRKQSLLRQYSWKTFGKMMAKIFISSSSRENILPSSKSESFFSRLSSFYAINV